MFNDWIYTLKLYHSYVVGAIETKEMIPFFFTQSAREHIIYSAKTKTLHLQYI